MDIDLLLESEGLYQTVLETGQTFTYRILTQKEYRVFRALRDSGTMHPWNVATKVFARCYVGDAAFLSGDLPAGIEISIGNLILYLSGDCQGAIAQDIAIARAKNPPTMLSGYMKRVISMAFPAYTWEDLDSWTYPKFIEMFVVAESVLVNRGIGYEPIDLDEIMLEGQKPKKPSHGINFEAENASIRKSLGVWNELEAQPSGLSMEQLRSIRAAQGA